MRETREEHRSSVRLGQVGVTSIPRFRCASESGLLAGLIQLRRSFRPNGGCVYKQQKDVAIVIHPRTRAVITTLH